MKILRPITAADKPPFYTSPGAWQPWALAVLYVALQSTLERQCLLEEQGRVMAREIDRLHQRRRAA